MLRERNNHRVPWPNGKALLSGGKDWEFESPWYRRRVQIYDDESTNI